MRCGVVLEQKQFVAALAEGEEKGKQHGADYQPGGYLDLYDQSARHRPDDEAAGDGEYIKNDDVLQPERVEEL